MSSKRILLFNCFLVVLFFWGCASRREIVRFKEQLDFLEESNKRLERKTVALDSLAQVQLETLYRLRADFTSNATLWEEKFTVVESKLDDIGSRFPELAAKFEASKIKAQASDTSAKEVSGAIPDPLQLYQTAHLDLTKGNYDLAISGFREYLKYFPGSELADNALYWVGECFYGKEDYNSAIMEFEKILENYPQGDKVPAGLYKLGMCYSKLGQLTKANQYFRDVANRFPNSPEAKLAREKISSKKR